jgi:cytochrome c oxidase cbb3-type subunit 2
MKHFPVLLFGIFIILVSSFLGLISTSLNQLGNLKQSTESLELNDAGELILVEGDPLYPMKLSGLSEQGRMEYIQLGCISCHSQQVRREELGKDLERDFGQRVSVPRDYIMQSKVLLGYSRLGPDLSNVGARIKDFNWHLLHLYNPQLTSPGSLMPPFPFLFEAVEISETTATDSALVFPEGNPYTPKEGIAIIPTKRAIALVEYLLNLDIYYSLPEALITKNDTGK